METCKSFFEKMKVEEIFYTNNRETLARVRINDGYEYTLKAMINDKVSNEELKRLISIRTKIIDRNLSFAFIRIKNHAVCDAHKNIGVLSPQDKLLYITLNIGNYFLGDLPFRLSHYELKCLIFEMLHGMYISIKTLGLSFRVLLNEVMILNNEVDRIYSLNKVRITSSYIPMYTNFYPSKDPIGDLLIVIADLMEMNIDLSEKLLAEFALFYNHLNNSKNLESILVSLNSSFFDDLRNPKIVSVYSHQDFTVIKEL